MAAQSTLVRLFGEVRPRIGSGLLASHQIPVGPLDTETTSVWSFPTRGSWAGHGGDYRGNWSPHVPRNLILKYTSPGDLVVDPMVGGGTTVVECILLGRHVVGVDVNPEALSIALDRARGAAVHGRGGASARLFHGDARDLAGVPAASVDLVTLHPPYADIIRYSDGKIAQDLSSIGTIPGFFEAIRKVADECFRVLRPGKHCAVLMGDTRRNGHLVPLSFRLFQEFLGAGFIVREHIIKLQWNTTSERTSWAGKATSFYKLAHEHLFVFRKLGLDEPLEKFDPSRAGFGPRSPTPPKGS